MTVELEFVDDARRELGVQRCIVKLCGLGDDGEVNRTKRLKTSDDSTTRLG